MGTESLTYEGFAPLSVFAPKGAEMDQGALDQIMDCLDHPSARAGALMADHHLGYAMPIGGVIAYEDAISPTGVGFDIACGNMAVKTDIQLKDLIGAPDDCPEGQIPFSEPEDFNARIKPIMRAIQKKVEFDVGRQNPVPVEHELFEGPVWEEIDRKFGPELKKKARAQLGTVGSGNHYVDLLVDGEGWVWIANHFGSRGLGHTIASGFMAAAGNLAFTDRVKESEEPIVFSTKDELGTFYVAAMRLAGEYAYAGREYVTDQVLEILGAESTFSVHNHHNFAWLENGLWVVRKGATPLTQLPAFIGGSMGDVSVIVRGITDLDKPTLGPEIDFPFVQDIGAIGSAPHGAGRVMSRTAAAGKFRKMWSCSNRDCGYTVRAEAGVTAIPTCPDCGGGKFRKVKGRDPSTARIDWDATRETLTKRGITVLGAGADEAPGVYKNLGEVILAHENIEVLYTLRPIGVVMAGADTFDPYKD